jgi:hypothetical protein
MSVESSMVVHACNPDTPQAEVGGCEASLHGKTLSQQKEKLRNVSCLFIYLFILVILEFELRASHLLGRCSTISASPQTQVMSPE